VWLSYRPKQAARKARDEGPNAVESSYSIDQTENLVRMKVGGRLSVEGLTLLMKHIGEDPQYRTGMHAIADFRECVGSWDYSEIQRFRDYVVRACGAKPRRWASIVQPGELEAVGRVLIVISEAVEARIRMRLFDDVAEAHRWIRGEDV
jgi:hypothetical protein